MNPSEEPFWGISIAEDELTAVAVRPQEEPPLITFLDRVPLSTPFDFSPLREGGVKEALVVAVQALSRGLEKPTRTALAISDRLALVKCIPVDRGLQKDEIAEQVRWEVDQLLVASTQEYVVDSSHVVLDNGTHDRLVLVAIRRAIIDVLKEVGKTAGLRMAAVDLDVFAGLRAVIYNYQLAQGNTTGVLRLSSTAATLALVRHGELHDLCEAPLAASRDDEAGTWGESRAHDLWEELQRRIGNGKVSRLLVYGAPAPVAFVAKLRPRCTIPVDVVNPVQRLKLAPVVGGTEVSLSGANVVAAIGAALRGVPRSGS